jgi:hypothetical protein
MNLIKDAKYYKYLEDLLPAPITTLTRQEINALIALRQDAIASLEVDLIELKDTVVLLKTALNIK